MKSHIVSPITLILTVAGIFALVLFVMPQLVLASAAEENAGCCGEGASQGPGGGGGPGGPGDEGGNNNGTYLGVGAIPGGGMVTPLVGDMALISNANQQTISIGPNAQITIDQSDNSGGIGGGSTLPGLGCSFPPRLFTTDIYFERTDGLAIHDGGSGGIFSSLSGATQVAQVGNAYGGSGGATPNYGVDQNDMEIGVQYTPKVLIENRGCQPTNQGTTTVTTRASRFHFPTTTEYPPVYVNDPPAGENGSFPVALRIDFGQDGTYEYNEVVNSAGPLPARAGGFVTFPPITLTEAGTHTIEATTDVRTADGRYGGVGCSGSDGCILERDGVDADKDRSETFAAIAPSVSLGSFLMNSAFFFSPLPTDVRLTDRDITTGDTVGLYWTGEKVNYTSCIGSVTTSDGSNPNDFNGQPDGNSWYVNYIVGPYNDINITEPSAGNWHFYTITCNTTGGDQVSDSIMINNGGDVTDLMALQPALNSLSLPTGATLDGAPFTITNQSPNTATDYTYTFSIDGSEVDTGLVSGPLAAGATEVQLANFTYTAPDTIAIVPMEVCMTHADMSAPACANAQINVFQGITECSDSIDNDLDSLTDAADPGCWTDPTDPTTYDASDTSEIDLPPTITATPGIVRQGDSFLLEWDPQGNPGCSLSANAVADGSIAGSLTITAQTQSTYTITCTGDQSASVRVQVIPNIFET